MRNYYASGSGLTDGLVNLIDFIGFELVLHEASYSIM